MTPTILFLCFVFWRVLPTITIISQSIDSLLSLPDIIKPKVLLSETAQEEINAPTKRDVASFSFRGSHERKIWAAFGEIGLSGTLSHWNMPNKYECECTHCALVNIELKRSYFHSSFLCLLRV